MRPTDPTRRRTHPDTPDDRSEARKVRYAVVGLGYIAQIAVLPAFANARRNSRLVALVSSDAEKLARLGDRYGVDERYDLDQLDECLDGGRIDALYIATPNDTHRDLAVRAARAGIHVLCEKPLALSIADCVDMISAAEEANVRLMTAYRLHFERANLTAAEIVRSGEIGEPRIFSSNFTMQVRDVDNIRLQRERGGGTLWDIGIYCINAARSLFAAEPIEAFALAVDGSERRFREVEEAASCILRFPGDRLASFTCSFGAADVGGYRVIGTRGDLCLESAYEYAEPIEMCVTSDDRTQHRRFVKRDQFGAEIVEFSDCVLSGRDPEPSGWEGLADVRVIEALYRSVRQGRPRALAPFHRRRRPSLEQEIHRPPIARQDLVHAHPPGGDDE